MYTISALPSKRRLTNTLNTGFTVVELIVVISVILILAAVTIISYGAWQQRLAEQQVASDLNGVKAAMDSARNFNKQYPASIPSSFLASNGTTLTYVYGTGTEYCVEAQHTGQTSVKYFLNSNDSSTPKSGSCPAQAPPVPVMSGATIIGTQAQVAWGPVAGASGYDVQYRKNSENWTSVTSSSASTTINGLTLASSYDFRVRSKNSSAASAWSSALSRKTVPIPTVTSFTDLGCGNNGGYDVWLNVRVVLNATSNAYTAYYQLEGHDVSGAANLAGTGSLTIDGTSSQWVGDATGSGTIYVYGIGPNGEKSPATTWTSSTYGPYAC